MALPNRGKNRKGKEDKVKVNYQLFCRLSLSFPLERKGREPKDSQAKRDLCPFIVSIAHETWKKEKEPFFASGKNTKLFSLSQEGLVSSFKGVLFVTKRLPLYRVRAPFSIVTLRLFGPVGKNIAVKGRSVKFIILEGLSGPLA